MKERYLRSYLRFLFFTFLLLSMSVVLKAQSRDDFTRNVDTYFEELSAVMLDINSKFYTEKGETLLEEFSGYWFSDYYSRDERNRIYDLSDLMRRKRMRAYPHFYDFLSALISMGEVRLDKKSQLNWLEQLERKGDDTKTIDLASFLEFSRIFTTDRILYEKRSKNWHFEKAKYSFEIDTSFIVRFQKADLIGTSGRDSTRISETSGVFIPEYDYWRGRGGKIFWTRVGLDEKDVFVSLNNYELDLTLVRFKADSAVMRNKLFFDEALLGKLEENVLSTPPSRNSSYPRFDSYFKDFFIKDIVEGIDAEGGIAMEGAKLICNSKKDNYARLTFETGEKIFTKLESNKFEIFDDEIQSDRNAFTLYHGIDSIYHPGLKLKFDLKERVLRLIQVNPNNLIIPFYDSYHKFDLYSETLNWELDENKLTYKAIRNVGNESTIFFESENYYSEFDYYKLQGIDVKNPLNVITDFARDYGTEEINPELLAKYIRKPSEQVISMLLTLEGMGFLVYEPDKKVATIKDKLYNYLNAKADLIDYDVIRIESVSRVENNAVMDLKDFTIQVNGVQEVVLSNPQKVYIYPFERDIVLLGNRDFVFSGEVKAGLFEFFSDSCYFNYDTFNLRLPDIDSVSFYVKIDSVDNEGNPLYRKIISVIEDLNGFIQIDKPNNKAAREILPQYPVFTCNSNAYVYYDDSFIADGVYNRQDFYYEMDPFVIDSLDNFTTDGIAFRGYLASADIFPTIDQKLVVMPDFSLGFTETIPEDGYPLYSNKARFYNKITLNGEGLTGEGEMTYLNSRSLANNFIFYPDSMRALAEDFHLAEEFSDIEYPEIEGKMIDEKFLPGDDQLVLTNTSYPFKMYKNHSEFEGTIYLGPGKVNGDGIFNFEKTSVVSNNFSLKHHALFADTSDFRLYTDTSFTELAFFSDNYRSEIDFVLREGRFLSNGTNSLLEFPFNQYVCTMDEMEWDMDANKMVLTNHISARLPDLNELSKKELMDIDLTGSDFISTHPDQDSLRFFSVNARYDLDSNTIYAENVKLIRVADAAIFPKDGMVTIQENARMETLLGADIITDTVDKYHHIHHANINIFSRRNYEAKGFYDYTDYASFIERIKFSTISADSLGNTYALTYVSDTAKFNLNPFYEFYGNIRLDAGVKDLYFDGGFRLLQGCYQGSNDWVRFDTILDPSNVILPVPEGLYNTDGEPLNLAINYSGSHEGFYPSFFEKKKSEYDVEVLSSYGNLYHSGTSKIFTVTDEELTEAEGSLNNYLRFDEKDCTIRGKGKLDFGDEMPYIDIDPYGELIYYIIPDSVQFKAAVGLDMYIDEDMLEMLTDAIQIANLRGVNLNTPFYNSVLRHFLGDEESKKLTQDILLYGSGRKVPDEMNYTFFLSDLNLIWNPDTRSYISKGDIGLISIHDVPVNKYVRGYIEIQKRSAGDELNIYFEVSKKLWYFFNYRNYILQTVSSDETYNEMLMEMKNDKRFYKERDEDDVYEIIFTSKGKRNEFVNKMDRIYGY